MASKSTRKRIFAASIDPKYAARVGAIAFTLGICGAVVTSPGVAWADDVTGSGGSTTESKAQPASTGTDDQNSPTEPNTNSDPATEPAPAASATTKKGPLSSLVSQTVISLRKVIVRSSGGALTSRRDTSPIVENGPTPEETPPAGDEELSLEEDVPAGPVTRLLESFLPQHVTTTGLQPQSFVGTARAQQSGSPDLAVAHVAPAHVDPAHEDPTHVDDVVPGIEDLTNAFEGLGDLLSSIGGLTTGGALPPLPQLPFPGPDSPEPVAKAWACLCSLVAEARPLTDRLSTAFNEIFAPIIAGPDPNGETPSGSPLNWAVLAWVRKQADEVLTTGPIADIMQTVQAYSLQGWQQFLVSCAGPTEGLPAEFERTVLVEDLNEPLDFVFLPDGGILIAEKGGAIKLYKEGQDTTTVVTLPVKTDFESGIGGIEVDPDYATNHYVYVAYTNANNQDMLSRFTLVGTQQDILESELVMIQTGDAAGPSHHGGEIYYEDNPDGEPDYIYWAKGDNNIGANAQNLSNLHGKIMRVYAPGTEPLDQPEELGLVPADNPFVNTPGARKEIWAYGFRNPFRFTTTPDGQLLVGDVGAASWEELNLVKKGANYGWPNAEGTTIGSGQYVNPVYTYSHATQPAGTGSITSVLVYTDDALGEEYQGKVFIADYTAGWIKVLDLGPNYSTYVSEQTLDGQAGTPVKLLQGPNGEIYQLNIYPGELSVIAPSGGNRAPKAVLTATPTNGPDPLAVTFSSAGSTDPDPDSTLTYTWDFGDGSEEASGPTASHTYATDGIYTVTLTVSDGQKSDQATQKITAGSTPPKIQTLTVNDDKPTYNPGDTITFAGSATDDEQTLQDSAYKWTVLFHHENHVHPAATIVGQKSGSITVPLDQHAGPGEETWYTITLTVTDSTGLSTTQTVRVDPSTGTQTIVTGDPETALTVTFDEEPSSL